MTNNIYFIYAEKQLRELIDNIENGKYKPHNDILIIDSEVIDVNIEDMFNLVSLAHHFKYICYGNKVVYTNDNTVKRGDECMLSHLINQLFDIQYIKYVPSRTILSLLKFIAEKQNTTVDKLFVEMKITNTDNPIDKIRVITEALKYDTMYVLQSILDGINATVNEVKQLINSITTHTNNKF